MRFRLSRFAFAPSVSLLFASSAFAQTSAPTVPSSSNASSDISLPDANPPTATTATATPHGPNETQPGPAPLPTPSAEQPKAPVTEPGHFEFGSYGRVHIASDLRGGTGRSTNVIDHGSRVDEDDYAELELRREDTFQDNIKTRVVATMALFAPFFHFSGDATQQIAIRNLYAQATYDRYTFWAGSRMYRGDDIYLLDWWPLDNQNTVGGGVGARLPNDDTTIALHVGMQRLDNAYQFEQVQTVAPFGLGSTTVTQLDRPRMIETLKATHLVHLNGKKTGPGVKIVGYGEVHEMAAGVYFNDTTNLNQALPANNGFVIGTELAAWSGERDTFVQIFARHARGIAAYDPLAVPITFANDMTASGASETLFALGGNYEHDWYGLLVGGYVRFFRDGDPSPTSMQKFDEGTLILRPQAYFGEHWGLAVEGSFQARRYAFLDPKTNEQLTPSVWKGVVMPYFSPAGRGSYKRPQFRLMYQVSVRNQSAEDTYPAADVFAQRKVEHFAGLGVEWWFNSSSYP